jgi:type II secretory ATPase GspE/PulE/Tfp pilus assembly ATPase PilB-like protein
MDDQSPNLSDSTYQRILSQFSGDWVARLNIDQMFVLIDGILPFEACLYYQVLPLFLDGNRLHLGMVSLDDTAASDYVRRIICYLNYSLLPHPISSEALRVVLTTYLNYADKQQKGQREVLSYGHYRARGQARQGDPSERRTLIVDSPESLYSPEPDQDETAIASPAVQTSLVATSSTQPTDSTDSAAAPQTSAQAPQPIVETSAAESTAPDQPLAILHVQSSYLTSPVEVLATLSPEQLVEELLARVLLGGIGRLYFERYREHGRIVWSQNGVLQSMLDNLALPVLEGMIAQLKQMAGLVTTATQQVQQTETEYLYDRSCVLLRFRFIPNAYGEEATVQVLRGAALKFYQQQQLNKLGHDAISIAKQLQNKLNEIRVRAYADPKLVDAKTALLPKLNEVFQDIEQQLNALEVNRELRANSQSAFSTFLED